MAKNMISIGKRIKQFIFEEKCIPWRLKNYSLYRIIKDLPKGYAQAVISARLLGNNVSVDRWTYVGEGSRVHSFTSEDKVIIGKFCSIADNVEIFAGGEHGHRVRVANYPLRKKILNIFPNPDVISKGPVVIGNDVWIGSHAIILSGVTIGDGAVVGAAAVISKNVPPYGIAVGNPMRIIGYRFSDEIIQKLLEIKWWDWEDERIIDSCEDLYSEVEFFVQKYYKPKNSH